MVGRAQAIRGMPLVLVLAPATAGCNGPKDSCEGTMNSYAGNINGQDWDNIVELFTPPERAKFGDRRIKAMMRENWTGAKNYKWKFMQADVETTGKLCVARTIARCERNTMNPPATPLSPVRATYRFITRFAAARPARISRSISRKARS